MVIRDPALVNAALAPCVDAVSAGLDVIILEMEAQPVPVRLQHQHAALVGIAEGVALAVAAPRTESRFVVQQ
jgi:hypothetical protein